MSTELHLCACPDSLNLPQCSSRETCNLSCLLLYVHHLEKCTRCVQHLVGENETGCTSDNHCKRVNYCWNLRGDFSECLFRSKMKVKTFTFDRLVQQLQMLFHLDFANISYEKKGLQIKRSDVIEELPQTPNKSELRSTEILFCFIDLFRHFKRNMESCGMFIDSGDLCGVLQMIVQQMEENFEKV